MKSLIMIMLLTGYLSASSISSSVDNGDGTYSFSFNGIPLTLNTKETDVFMTRLRAGKALISAANKDRKKAVLDSIKEKQAQEKRDALKKAGF